MEARRPSIHISKPPPSKPLLASGVSESDDRIDASEVTVPGAVLFDHSGFMRFGFYWTFL